MDQNPQYSGNDLLIHYGSPLITRQNTVLVPVKTGQTDGFQIEARNAVDGSTIWVQPTQYSVPAQSWIPACGIVLSPKNRLYYPDTGGTISFRDAPDSPTPPSGGAGTDRLLRQCKFQRRLPARLRPTSKSARR